jgi:hypothetical protein
MDMRAVGEKSKERVESKLKELGPRGTAAWLVDYFLAKYVPLNASDLPDSASYANGLDSIEECLQENDFAGAIDIAQETAVYMLEDEGMDVQL